MILETCKSALFYGKEDIRIENVTLPDLEDFGLRIKVLSCGVCGSDVRYFLNGPSPRYKIPGIMGHEVCGEVVDKGPKIEDFSIGARVVLSPIIPCMNCAACSAGLDNLCERGWGFGNTCDGGFAEYITISSHAVLAGSVVEVPKSLDPKAVSLTELVGCCLNGIGQMGINEGDDVLIIGDGAIGLTFLQLLKHRGVRSVTTSGRKELRRTLAGELGADRAMDAKAVDLKKSFAGDFDHVIVAASSVEASSDAIHLIKPGGSLLLFSGYLKGSIVSFDPNIIHYKQLHIHGSIDCTIREFRMAAKIIPMLSMGKLITGSYPLEKTKEAFYASKNEDQVKIIIEP